MFSGAYIGTLDMSGANVEIGHADCMLAETHIKDIKAVKSSIKLHYGIDTLFKTSKDKIGVVDLSGATIDISDRRGQVDIGNIQYCGATIEELIMMNTTISVYEAEKLFVRCKVKRLHTNICSIKEVWERHVNN